MPKEFQIQVLIDTLIFGSLTIEEGLEHMKAGITESEITKEELKLLHDSIFHCESCTSWLPLNEKSKTHLASPICVDCGALEDDEDSSDDE